MDYPNPPRSAFVSASWENKKSQAKSQKNANLPNWMWYLIALLPLGGLFLTQMTTRGPGENPTVSLFENWLQSNSITNPLASHVPFRHVAMLVYVSTRRTTQVRAAMSGVISKIEGQTVELSAKDKNGLPVIVSYSGLTSVSVKLEDEVQSGNSIGTLEAGGSYPDRAALRVRVTVNGSPLPPPEGLRLVPFPHNW